MTKTDFTTDNPGKQVLLFSLPLMASMLLQSLYTTADSIIVGRFIGENALAAVGTCGSLSMMLLLLISGATDGMSVIVSQFLGAKEDKQVRRTIVNSFLIIVVLSILIAVAGAILARQLLVLINVPDNIIDDAVVYLRIYFAGIIATSMYNMANSLSRAVGDSLTPMLVLIVSSVLNVGMNILFVAAFGMGVAGVAYATVLATALAAVVCWGILWKKNPVVKIEKNDFVLDGHILKLIVKIGVPSALRASTTSIGNVLVQNMINSYGSVVMAAFSAGRNVESLIGNAPGGITQAMQVFTGQNVGAGRYGRVRAGFRAAFRMILLYSVFSGAAMIFFGEPILRFFNPEGTEMIKAGCEYLFICAFGTFFVGFTWLSRCVLIGAGDAKHALLVSLIEITAKLLSAYVLSTIVNIGYVGIFLGTPIGSMVAGAYGMYHYHKGNWVKSGITDVGNSKNK